MAFCRDSPAEIMSELALGAWGLSCPSPKRKNCPLSRPQTSDFRRSFALGSVELLKAVFPKWSPQLLVSYLEEYVLLQSRMTKID